MNQKEFNQKLNQAREIQDRAARLAEESQAFVEVDFKKSNDMLMASIALWRQGGEIALNAISQAIDSGLLNITEEDEKKLAEINSAK